MKNTQCTRGFLHVCLLASALAATHLAHAAYIGPNLFGAWASASADTVTNTSGPSEQTPDGPAPNGWLSANASASGGNGNGAGSGQGFANVGLLGGNAAASGCLGGNFQQVCIAGGSYTEFYDTFQVTGAPDGTPVTIQFTLATAVNLMGFGGGGYQTRFSDGFNQADNSGTFFVGSYGGDVLQTHSWSATYNVGTSYSLAGTMNMSVGEENCPGGSQNCGQANSLTMNVTSWKASAKILHCPTCRIQSASGFNYLQSAQAQTLKTLHTFKGTDGDSPVAGLTQATDGNLYGTTQLGGANDFGAVFKITRSGTLTPLYSFCQQTNCADGDEVSAGVIQGSDGNLYGTTEFGGANDLGTVYRITRAGALTTLHSFDATDGSVPAATLIQATDGNFYGTTSADGANIAGTVFKITHGGTLATLNSFDSLNGRPNLNSALIQAADGNFYGTTYSGGAQFAGTVFKITHSGTLTTLYQFCSQSSCTDGSYPDAGLIQATDGNLYGTTAAGGANGNGTVFKITPSGMLTTLHSFDSSDGVGPAAGLIQATDGNFYGTTQYGGANGDGTIFKITPSGSLTTLHSFNSSDGSVPVAGLTQATDGNFYGTTSSDATGFGTVFRLSLGLSPFVETQARSGKVGATVKILGTNLTAATSVTFNGTAATAFTVLSKSEIKVTVPAGATTGIVQVVTPQGTLNSNGVFTVN